VVCFTLLVGEQAQHSSKIPLHLYPTKMQQKRGIY